MKALVTISLSLLALLFGSCTEDSSDSSANNQQIIVWAHEHDYFNDVEAQNTQINGVVNAPEMVEFAQCTINNLSSAQFTNQYRLGYLGFWNTSMVPFIDDELSITVETNYGELSGAVHYPGTITDINSPNGSNIQIGEDLTLNWDIDGTPDFVWVDLTYEYEINGISYWTDVDTVVTADNVTFGGLYFQYPGTIYLDYITACSGPIPGPGEPGNLTGIGEGFLYYEGEDNYIDMQIIVGVQSVSPGRPKIKTKEDSRSRLLECISNSNAIDIIGLLTGLEIK